MSDNVKEKHQGPIRTHWGFNRDVFVKVWEKQSKDGKLFYDVTVGKTYKDPKTGEKRDTNSLNPRQMNELTLLINEANFTLNMLNDRKKENERGIQAALAADKEATRNPIKDLKAQRDAVIENAKPPALPQNDSPTRNRSRIVTPEL